MAKRAKGRARKEVDNWLRERAEKAEGFDWPAADFGHKPTQLPILFSQDQLSPLEVLREKLVRGYYAEDGA